MELECIKSINCQQGAVRAVRFNVDGSYCLTCGSDRQVKLWNPHRSLHLKTYGGHGNEVLDVSSSCDNSQIVSCSSDKSVILWDVTTGQLLRRLRNHASTVTCVKFNEDGSVAVSGSQDNSVLFWDVKSRKNEPIQILNDAKDSITSIDINDAEIVTASLDCKVRKYDIRMGQLVSDFLGEAVTCVNLTNDSQCYVISCADDTVRLLDKDSGELLQEYKGHKNEEYIIESCVNQKDSYILSGSVDGFFYCWELVSGTVNQYQTKTNSKVIHSLSPHPSENMILTAAGGCVELWGTDEPCQQ